MRAPSSCSGRLPAQIGGAGRYLPRVRSTLLAAGLFLGALAGLPLCDLSAQAPAGRVIISDVLIQGNKQVPTEQIRNMLKTRPGQEYVPEIVQQDARDLYSTRQFGNVYADQVGDGPGKVKIIFNIRDYPTVIENIEYRGAHAIKRDDLDTLTNLRRGAPLNPVANKVACRRIVSKYNEEGRPFAACELIKGGEPGDTEIIFNITEGPKVRVKAIGFTGNSFVSAEVLRTHINASNGLLRLGMYGTPYSAALIDNDIAELIKYYRNFGYHDVRVGRALKWSPDGDGVEVTYVIEEGTRYKIAALPTVHGVKSLPIEVLEAQTKFKQGDYYDQGKVDADLGRIKDWLGMKGLEVRANAVPVWSKPGDDSGIVTVHYEVDESQPRRVGQVIIVGNERTRQNVILRQLPLYPGQILTYPDLRVGERNLARLGIFDNNPDAAGRPVISVLEPLDPESPYRDILVNIQEANTGSFLFGVGVNSDSGLTGSIVLNERNFDLFNPPTSIDEILNGTAFRGAGQEFRLEAVPGTQLQRYTATFREPFLFDSPYSLTVSGYYYQRYFNEYSEDRLGSRVTIGRKVSDYWSIAGTIRAENVNVYDVPATAPADYQNIKGDNTQIGFRGSVTRDSRDSYLRATEGSLVDFGFEQVIGTYNFPLVSLDANKFFTTYQRADGSGRHVLAVHGQVAWAGDNTPAYERYFGGGFRSIRGFQFRGVGPDINGFKVGGDFMMLNSLEYQIPLRANDQIYLVGFVDSGTVTSSINHIDDYRVSAGFGLRFVVPMLGPVPIALDFGFPIVKGPNDNEQIFNFWMGFFR